MSPLAARYRGRYAALTGLAVYANPFADGVLASEWRIGYHSVPELDRGSEPHAPKPASLMSSAAKGRYYGTLDNEGGT